MIDIALVAVLIAALFVFFALYARVMHHRVLYDPPKPIAGISASAATAVAYAGAAMMVLIPVLPVFVVLGSRSLKESPALSKISVAYLVIVGSLYALLMIGAPE